MFSSRLSWNPSTNRITRSIEALKRSGAELVDLTETNPTAAGFDYDSAAVCLAISAPAILEYHPSPRGLIPARQAVVDYYRHHGKAIDRETVFLTSSTSESYACLFKLLCDPEDTVLAPQPSYPLFDFLAGMLGAKKFGATWRGMTGAVIGGIVGLFFGLPGIILGPFLGAMLFEMLGDKEFKKAVHAGVGATVGLLLGIVGKFSICVVMIIFFATNVVLHSLN